MEDGQEMRVENIENRENYNNNLDDNNPILPPPQSQTYCHNPMMMPSLQQISSGIWSDASFEQHHPHQLLQDYGYNENGSSMENNEDPDSDYFDSDVEGEESGSIEEVEGEETSGDVEEEEESTENDNDSRVADMIVDLQSKFQQLVFSTIGAAEDFLDRPSTLHMAVLSSQNNGDHHLFKEATFSFEEKEGFFAEMNFESAPSPPFKLDDNQVTIDGSCNIRCSQYPCHDVETQTDDDILRSSGTLIPNHDEAAATLKAEQVELEICELEAVNESLITELERWRDLLEEDVERTEEELKEAKRTICKIQESIEAVDKAIELKSSVISEAQGATSAQDSTRLQKHSDMEFSEMVTNLETLSAQDLQRLLGVYFNKTVELSYTSQELEDDLEKATNRREELTRRYSRKKEQMREVEEQHRMRILEFVCKNADPTYYSRVRRKEEQLAASKKRQQDLEKSLTALLVRHGYLLDGVDYDVKQVVRTLGIEEAQLSAVETKGRTTRRGGVQMSAGIDEMSGPSSGERDVSSKRKSGHPQTNTARDQKRYSGSSVMAPRNSPPPPEFEVTREKRRITIQPSTASGGGGGCAPPSVNRKSGGGSSGRKSFHR